MDKEAIARVERADEILGEKLCALSATLPLFGFFSALENAETYEAVVAAKQALSAAILALQPSERDLGDRPDLNDPDFEERLRKAYCVQQKSVPDQAAIVWRSDLLQLFNAYRRMQGLLSLSPAEPSPESREGWQPIETAKREQRVLIDGGHYGVTEAMLMDDGKWHVAAYNGTHPTDNPTVWMPLPASAIRALSAPAHD